jgi:hypothetical protein
MLAGCSPPVMFRVEVDEPISGGELTLNGNSVKLMKNIDGAYWAKWAGADAGGEIIVHYADGMSARCEIGYVTHGMTDIQDFRILRRACVALPVA